MAGPSPRIWRAWRGSDIAGVSSMLRGESEGVGTFAGGGHRMASEDGEELDRKGTFRRGRDGTMKMVESVGMERTRIQAGEQEQSWSPTEKTSLSRASMAAGTCTDGAVLCVRGCLCSGVQ
jgi:hypothetical protein